MLFHLRRLPHGKKAAAGLLFGHVGSISNRSAGTAFYAWIRATEYG